MDKTSSELLHAFGTDERKTKLLAAGFKVGRRDARINTDYQGKYMVAESYDESELPTKNGANGPWAIVGDDLDALIDAAYADYPGDLP